MREMAQYEDQLLPLLMGVYTVAHQGAAYASSVDDRRKHKLCLGCGAISEEWECPVCGNGRSWLVGVEVPENTEEIQPTVDDTEMEVSLPNISFGDYAPEMPVQPRRWEVFFDGLQSDIFKATTEVSLH